MYVCYYIYSKRGELKEHPERQKKDEKMTKFTFKDKEGKTYRILECDFLGEWNEFCEENNRHDSEIFSNDEDFLDMFSKSDIAMYVAYGHFSPMDEYIALDRNGNFSTSNNPLELAQHFNFTDDADFMDAMKKYRVD